MVGGCIVGYFGQIVWLVFGLFFSPFGPALRICRVHHITHFGLALALIGLILGAYVGSSFGRTFSVKNPYVGRVAFG